MCMIYIFFFKKSLEYCYKRHPKIAEQIERYILFWIVTVDEDIILTRLIKGSIACQ